MVEGARFVGWRQALGGSAEIRGWRRRCGGEDERDQTPTLDHVPTVRSFLKFFDSIGSLPATSDLPGGSPELMSPAIGQCYDNAS